MTAGKCLLRLTDAEIKAGLTEGLSSYFMFLSLGKRGNAMPSIARPTLRRIGGHLSRGCIEIE